MIKILQYNKENWDLNLQFIKGVSLNYTSLKIEFNAEYSYGKNISFMIEDNNKPVLVTNLTLDKNNDISWAGRYCFAPYVSDDIPYDKENEYIDYAMKYIMELAKKYNSKNIMLQIDPKSGLLKNKRNKYINYLLKYNFICNSTTTIINKVDLFKKNISNSVYDKLSNELNLKIIDYKNVNYDYLEIYKKVYELDAGKVTRNSEMINKYYEFIKNNQAKLYILYLKDEPISVLINEFYKNVSYFSSYAEYYKDFDIKNVGLFMQNLSFEDLKKSGINYHEMGEQFYNLDEKNNNISAFKRNFGGLNYPYFKGIYIV